MSECAHIDPTGQDRDCPCQDWDDEPELVCAICGEPEGSVYAKTCCVPDQMIEA